MNLTFSSILDKFKTNNSKHAWACINLVAAIQILSYEIKTTKEHGKYMGARSGH